MLDARRRLTSLTLALICAYLAAGVWAGAGPEPVVGSEEPSLPSSSAPFVGELDGFEFYDSSLEGGNDPPACRPDGGREATPEEVTDSPLFFVPDYLPAGALELSLRGTVCGDEVVTVVNDYRLPGDGLLIIARIDSPPRVPATASREELHLLDVGGRRAVLNAGAGASSRIAEVYVHDEPGYLYLNGIQVDVDELLRVAAGVRSYK